MKIYQYQTKNKQLYIDVCQLWFNKYKTYCKATKNDSITLCFLPLKIYFDKCVMFDKCVEYEFRLTLLGFDLQIEYLRGHKNGVKKTK